MMNKEVKSYLASVPAERAAHVNVLHELIVDLFPDAAVSMKFKMPTYHVGEEWVAIANQKGYVSLYTCGAAHIAKFKEKHPKYKTGKGCINFKASDMLPIQDLKGVIQHAVRHPKGNYSQQPHLSETGYSSGFGVLAHPVSRTLGRRD